MRSQACFFNVDGSTSAVHYVCLVQIVGRSRALPEPWMLDPGSESTLRQAPERSSEGALRCLLQHLVVQSQVSHRSPQSCVLRLQLLETSRLVDSEPPYSAHQR